MHVGNIVSLRNANESMRYVVCSFGLTTAILVPVTFMGHGTYSTYQSFEYVTADLMDVVEVATMYDVQVYRPRGDRIASLEEIEQLPRLAENHYSRAGRLAYPEITTRPDVRDLPYNPNRIGVGDVIYCITDTNQHNAGQMLFVYRVDETPHMTSRYVYHMQLVRELDAPRSFALLDDTSYARADGMENYDIYMRAQANPIIREVGYEPVSEEQYDPVPPAGFDYEAGIIQEPLGDEEVIPVTVSRLDPARDWLYNPNPIDGRGAVLTEEVLQEAANRMLNNFGMPDDWARHMELRPAGVSEEDYRRETLRREHERARTERLAIHHIPVNITVQEEEFQVSRAEHIEDAYRYRLQMTLPPQYTITNVAHDSYTAPKKNPFKKGEIVKCIKSVKQDSIKKGRYYIVVGTVQYDTVEVKPCDMLGKPTGKAWASYYADIKNVVKVELPKVIKPGSSPNQVGKFANSSVA